MVWRRGGPYSLDLRERVFAAADDGAQVCEAAEMLHVSVSYVSKVLERRRTTGETSARPHCGHGCGRPIRSRRVSGWFGAPWPCSA